MSWPDDDIDELVVGERPTLIEAEKGNEVIKALNILRNIRVVAMDEDGVDYDDVGVWIKYRAPLLTGLNEEVCVLDASDPTKKFRLRWYEGILVGFDEEVSEWVEKTITICEDGSSVDYTFLVKTS
tara:strand:- start:152 stop:529 length:378 start_codon:yes stop_codon:yes gene_type:complete